MIASTSNCQSNRLMDSERMTKSESQTAALETPKFHYDLNFDLKVLQNVLKSADFLQDSGYKSNGALNEPLIKSTFDKPAPPPTCCTYGTGWMVADDLSDNGSISGDENYGKFRIDKEIFV
uniref:Uncharacterized protein n=2 Tax=Panagrolaimus sp. PS1159 TaxID=55785 RepID=A0AC35FY05_9BILA